jgi:hypothetical protein
LHPEKIKQLQNEMVKSNVFWKSNPTNIKFHVFRGFARQTMGLSRQITRFSRRFMCVNRQSMGINWPKPGATHTNSWASLNYTMCTSRQNMGFVSQTSGCSGLWGE